MGEEENPSSPSPSPDEEQLKQAILQISSLISVSHSIKVFTAKWQSARNKLQELLSHLAAIDNCELSGKTPSLSAAVAQILATLANCGDLARRCSELTFTGKLLMQSDLDILFSKLDSHIAGLRGIHAVEQSHALVVSRPSLASASRDEMRFYLNDVFSRLKIRKKREALTAFNEAAREYERHIKVGVEIDGFSLSIVSIRTRRRCRRRPRRLPPASGSLLGKPRWSPPPRSRR